MVYGLSIYLIWKVDGMPMTIRMSMVCSIVLISPHSMVICLVWRLVIVCSDIAIISPHSPPPYLVWSVLMKCSMIVVISPHGTLNYLD
jgi:hypothetical protein